MVMKLLKKLIKVYRVITKLTYKYLYLIMVVAVIRAYLTLNLTGLISIAILALICMANELRDSKDRNKIENAVKLLKTILDEHNKKEKKCELYSDTSKCPDKNCKNCKYFN